MKLKDVRIGETYLFYNTCVEHRKFMIRNFVKVIDKRGGGKKYPKIPNYSMEGIGKKPIRFKLDNGHYANAGELKWVL